MLIRAAVCLGSAARRQGVQQIVVGVVGVTLPVGVPPVLEHVAVPVVVPGTSRAELYEGVVPAQTELGFIEWVSTRFAHPPSENS